ncbi:MAG: hypothetical protein E7178_03185 [Erysipelotrichaceae bacterium]|jgi:hypothetical protein|nr:hypothetical protein [Erysipelotrichaceae bacterium]
MRKVRNNKNLKIIASISVVLFSLVATFSGAIAWFQAMRNTNNTTDSFKITPRAGLLRTLSIHELVENDAFIYNQTGDIVGYNFNPIAASDITINWGEAVTPQYNVDTPSLGQYSLLQKTNPLLLVFELNNSIASSSVTITATASETYNAEQYDTEASGDGNPLSWVVKYSSKAFSKQQLADSDYIITTESLSNEGHFATIDNSGTLSEFNKTQTFYHGNNSTEINYVFVVLDYYEAAMEFFYFANLGKDFISDATKDVPFNIDWTMEI